MKKQQTRAMTLLTNGRVLNNSNGDLTLLVKGVEYTFNFRNRFMRVLFADNPVLGEFSVTRRIVRMDREEMGRRFKAYPANPTNNDEGQEIFGRLCQVFKARNLCATQGQRFASMTVDMIQCEEGGEYLHFNFHVVNPFTGDLSFDDQFWQIMQN